MACSVSSSSGRPWRPRLFPAEKVTDATTSAISRPTTCDDGERHELGETWNLGQGGHLELGIIRLRRAAAS